LDDRALVLDASALIDLLLAGPVGRAVAARIDGRLLHAPAHLDAEVLSGLGRLQRAGRLNAQTVRDQLDVVGAAPLQRHPVAGLLLGAWARRERVRLADALYVELAAELDVPLVTTDARLGRAVAIADVVGG
jgi:predicted nucleic acid-binding protein